MMRLSSIFRVKQWHALLTCLMALAMLATAPAQAQIYGPEGVNIPGAWNGWSNYPGLPAQANFRAEATGGNIKLMASPTGSGNGVYQAVLNIGSGGDAAAGSYQWIWTSGSSSNPWGNKWSNTNVTLNTPQNYQYQGGPNNSINASTEGYYTLNLADNGYGNSRGIVMLTSAAPVNITDVTQSPAAGSVLPTNTVDITITLSAPKSAEENVLVRYSTNSFSTSTIVAATGSGTTYTATIPAQTNGTIVNYYAFTSTVAAGSITGDYNLQAIRYKNNSGSPYVYTSASLPPVDITFQVDMANELNVSSVSVAGSFNGFSTSANPLTLVSGTLYAATISIPANASLQYKFVKNGSTFEDNIGGLCGNGSNRTYAAGTGNATIAATCFSKCGACPPTRAVTFRVDMQNEAGVSSMNLAGEFNNWTPGATSMTAVGSVYSVTLNLEEGRQYSYKFVKNGTDWEPNIGAPCGDGSNRTYTVTTSPTQTVNLVCFRQCSPCASLSSITFQVDMRNVNVTNGVVMAGSFNSWSNTATPMARVGTTSVYQTTLLLSEGTTIQYKFINGNGTNNYEGNIIAPCGNGSNRTYTVPVGNATVDLTCFSSCGACPILVPVTFRVNMTGQTVGSGVSVSGNFNGWNINANPLTNQGGGIWSATVNIAQNTNIQYKFVNSGTYEAPISGPCNISTNRAVSIPPGGTTLPTVCWQRCTDCGAANVWVGGSASFSDPNNWSAGVVPNNCDETVVINSAANAPNIASGTFTCGSLSMGSGAAMTIANGATLGVCGNVTGNGSTITGGTLLLNGNSAQQVNGAITVNNLTIDRTSGSVAINGNARVANTLTLANGTSNLVINGTLTLTSNATGTGRLAPVPAGATITGNLSLERFFPATRGWYFVGAPFGSTATIQDFNELDVRVTPRNNANVYFYTENDTTSSRSNGVVVEAAGWKIPTANQAIGFSGFRVYAGTNFVSGPRTLVTSGTPNIGGYTTGYSFTTNMWDGGGWNLLANPYPCEIDWAALRFDASNQAPARPVSNAYHVWNGVNGNYASYTALSGTSGTGVNGASRYISSSQAFFIKATANGQALDFKEDHKSTTNGNTFIRDGAIDNELRIRFAKGADTDEAAILFYNGGTVGLDNFDAQNMGGSAVDVATVPVTGLRLAINVMPELAAQRYEIPVTFSVQGTGRMSATFSGMAGFATGTQLYLRDNFLGTVTDLNQAATYAFDVTSNPASKGAGRFVIVVAPASVTGIEVVAKTASLDVWPNPTATGRVAVSLTNFGGNQATLQLTDLAGRVVLTRTIALSADAYELDVAALPAGIYTLKAAGAQQTLTQRLVVR